MKLLGNINVCVKWVRKSIKIQSHFTYECPTSLTCL